MKTDEKGFSLVEVLIVIAMMGILLSVSAVSINLVLSGNIKRATSKINTTLESVRVQDMSYTDKPSLYFYQDGDGKYRMFVSSQPPASLSIACPEAQDAASFGNLSLTLTFTDSTGATTNITDLTTQLYQVQFNSNTGGLKQTTLSTGGSAYLNNIKIQKGTNGIEKNISIVAGTGKHSAD